jgi:hypothetical protein
MISWENELEERGMQLIPSRWRPARLSSRLFAVTLCATLVGQPAASLLHAQQSTNAGSQQASQKIPADQLDSLVAPIALYPDPMLAEVLAASTYPLEIIQLQQWLEKNPTLKDKALADAVMKEPWDPSVQGLAGLPEVVKRLANDIQWTADLGNAFLAQQSDVMEAVQRMRKKARDKGTLKSSEQVKVETQVIEKKEVVVIQQSNPQVVYVPSYNPVVVWGPPVYPYYPYPPIYYPPPGYYAAGVAISWGVGLPWALFGAAADGVTTLAGEATISTSISRTTSIAIPTGTRTSIEEIETRSTRIEVEQATNGNTIRSIAGARPMRIALPRTNLAATRAAIPCPAGRPTRGNRWADRVAACRAATAVAAGRRRPEQQVAAVQTPAIAPRLRI